MFDDLDEAISAFKVAVLGNEDMSSLSEYDLVFNGDFNKWVKFANSLKLRMAMRISSVSPALAKEKAEEAVSDVIGVMTSASDAAYSKYNDGMNPYYRVTSSWNEIRILISPSAFSCGKSTKTETSSFSSCLLPLQPYKKNKKSRKGTYFLYIILYVYFFSSKTTFST